MGIKRDVILSRKLFCFLEVAKKGNISQVAIEQGMKQSNLSRIISDLEQEFSTTLFERGPTMKLTQSGHELFEKACDLEKSVCGILKYSSALHKVEGDVVLWVGEGVANGCISQCLPGFYKKYPNVHLKIKCSLQLPPSLKDIDVAIVFAEPVMDPKSTVILGKYILPFRFCASKRYLAEFGYPKSMEDLQENHRVCVRDDFSELWPQWRESLPKFKHVMTTTDTSSVLFSLVKDGVGVGFIPKTMLKDNDNLIELNLPLKIDHPFWVIARRDAITVPKIKALTDYIKVAVAK